MGWADVDDARRPRPKAITTDRIIAASLISTAPCRSYTRPNAAGSCVVDLGSSHSEQFIAKGFLLAFRKGLVRRSMADIGPIENLGSGARNAIIQPELLQQTLDIAESTLIDGLN